MSTRPKPTVPRQRRCIFCSGSPLSGEHMWPAWMGRHFPKGAHDTRIESWEVFTPTMRPALPIERVRRQGHTTTRKYKVVCRRCNNGWMSRVEDAARPHLIGFMTGQPCTISDECRLAVTRWAILKATVLEQERPKDAVTTAEDRRAFMNTLAIPRGVQVWLFRCGQSPWDASLHRHSATALVTPSPPLNGRAKNTQTMLIGAREALIYVFQSYVLDGEMTFQEDAGRRIWPIREDARRWPPDRRASALDAESIADTLGGIIRNPKNIFVDQ